MSFTFDNRISDNNIIYFIPDFNIVEQLTNIKHLGIYLSDDFTSSSHIVRAIINIGKMLSCWILCSFIYIERQPTLILHCIKYGSQLWCPHLRK